MKNEQEHSQNFLSHVDDSKAPSKNSGIFGLSPSYEEAKVIIIPVEWDATASYRRGASLGPKGILQASHQLDLEDLCFKKAYQQGFHLLPFNSEINSLNEKAAGYAENSRNTNLDQDKQQAIQEVNHCSNQVNDIVYKHSLKALKAHKIPAILGGDHSSPFGCIKALSSQYPQFGILHIDAHFDLRNAYEGFHYSHASIMFNVLQRCPQIEKLVQVGIRDFCHSEKEETQKCADRIKVYYDQDIYNNLARGQSFHEISSSIIKHLPQNVYISFDIDGLDPSCCPNTGTPVPGGLSYHQAIYLIEQLALSGRKIIGFDLCEVVDPCDKSDWDLNVGARVLFKLAQASVYKTE